MSETSSRPSLPTSSSDFALPTFPSNSSANGSPVADPIPPLMLRMRRPSLLAPKSYYSESRIQSPLASFFTAPFSRKNSQNGTSEPESESDRERMWTDSSTSSENATPPLPPFRSGSDSGADSDSNMRAATSRSPSTPPHIVDLPELPNRLRIQTRRLSYPLKQPRVLSLQGEPKPEEDEVKSEAQFQRLVASCSAIPAQLGTPKAASNRGRYPEEAGTEDVQREDTPSDDGDEDATFGFIPSLSESICTSKASTPARSINGDEMWSDSPSMAMDIDSQYGSPSVASSIASTHWRYTPPPTTSAVRTNKRKLEDRFDPYPTSSKRRAVSPSLSYLRESHPLLLSPSVMSPRMPSTSRGPIPMPISIPSSTSTTSSLASSPTISQPIPIHRPNGFGSASISSSPTMRTSMALSSPVLRPMSRRRGEEEERKIEDAGEAVGGLTLQ